MPIFAKNKITIEEDCLLPSPKIWMSYSGPNPHKAYGKITEILKNNLKFKNENIQEREFKWDRSNVVEKFSGSIEAFKDFDKFTYIMAFIDFSGNVKPSKEFGKVGDLKVEIDGYIRTDYPQDTVWERSLFYEVIRSFWHKFFYQKERYAFKERCRNILLVVQKELKTYFDILPKS